MLFRIGFFLLACSAGLDGVSRTAFDLTASSEAAPTDGLVQLRLVARTPEPLTLVTFGLTFNAADGVAECPVMERAVGFSASGDVTALISQSDDGCRLWARLESPTGGIGRTPGLPVLVLSVPPGGGFAVETASAYAVGPEGFPPVTREVFFDVAVGAGGTFSVDRVRPSGETGPLAAGSQIEIEGHGFAASTHLEADSIALSNVEVVSPELLRATLAAPTDLVGKRLVVTNPGGESMDYWVGPRTSDPEWDRVFATFPRGAGAIGHCGPLSEHPGYLSPNTFLLQNPNTVTATVRIQDVNPNRSSSVIIEIPPGEVGAVALNDPPDSDFETSPQTPLRGLCYAADKGARMFGRFDIYGFWASSVESPPTTAWVGSAASFVAAAVAPGEIITVFGDFGLADSESAADIGLLFDGEPAPVLYASSSQINGVVPYSAAGEGTQIQVRVGDRVSFAWGVPVRAASPALFTAAGDGRGPAAALNADDSLNSPLNPAPKGSVIQLYGTGQGQTVPGGTAAAIAGEYPIQPILAPRVRIGGLDAAVVYGGSSAGSISGLLQVNAVIPEGVASGDAVPVTLEIGDARSVDGVTIAVE